jgi:hypothetical protein
MNEEKQTIRLTGEQLASALVKAIVALHNLSNDEIDTLMTHEESAIHFHDGSQSPIAWNDVQAIKFFNDYILKGNGPLLEVPEVATEGYNQHHHTSEFDGGVIPGLQGVHDHRDNDHGGFAFAVFHPATDVPQAAWED